ncbi:MAG: carbohydrate ABC transporter permease [Caldilineaceae bacterium]|nr:carbohydrate ABC transporter permease [Caldilineaceae bacterium]MBP8109446.1 carbohydrate ABC transporter permease [Caldilineaceae bacterium]MBP8124701.1 carbohydrate ABC transporter permease [Caldilineaceae bacterium]MBP9071683.1 carbohydrate ABC transporter permease [Caldilineaceae bacterium]
MSELIDLSTPSIRRSAQSAGLTGRLALHSAMIVGTAIMVAPFLVMLLVSLVPTKAFMSQDFGLDQFSLDNYFKLFRTIPFGRYYLNSTLVSVTVTVLRILISSLAAFAFGRLRFRGREPLFMLYLATLMIPFPVTLIPNFLIIRNFGWYDSYFALIVPGLFDVLSTFLLRQYYRGIPLEMDEAACMDGASSLRIWVQIILPLSGPVMAALAIFAFQVVWNDFLWPLVVTTSDNMRTIPVGLAALVGQYSTEWGLLMAGSVIALLPVLIIYMLGQNWFVKGITLSGMGGR